MSHDRALPDPIDERTNPSRYFTAAAAAPISSNQPAVASRPISQSNNTHVASSTDEEKEPNNQLPYDSYQTSSGYGTTIMPAATTSMNATSTSDPDYAKSTHPPADTGTGEKADAATTAANDPLHPLLPAGTGLEKGTTISDAKEGLAQMRHENPDTVGEVLKGLVGLGETKGTLIDFVPTPSDANTGNIPAEQLMAIAKRFQPAVWLNQNEHYRPCTMSWYFQHADLYYDPEGKQQIANYIKLKEQPSEDDLNEDALWTLLNQYHLRTNDPRLDHLTKENMERRRFHMAVRSEEDGYGQSFQELNQVPFLVRVRRYQDHWEILYIMTFAFNGPYYICCGWHGAHSADVEHITVRTNADATKLEWVYYGSHGMADGVWRRPERIELYADDDTGDLTHPVAYSAISSHGMYPSPGTWYRICACANDTVGEKSQDQHTLWYPSALQLLFHPADPRYGSGLGMRYLSYPGTLGEDGIQPPQSAGWWDVENEYQNNCFRRCWWPCRYIEWVGDQDFCYNSCQKKVDFHWYEKHSTSRRMVKGFTDTRLSAAPKQLPMER